VDVTVAAIFALGPPGVFVKHGVFGSVLLFGY
jgi:hypothetical protein